MGMLQTYSLPSVWDPDTEGNTSKVIAISGQEVTSLKLSTAGAGPATILLYDNNASANPTDFKWTMDAPAGGPDFNSFPNPLAFKKGIFAVLVQGAGLRPILNIAIIDDQV